MKKKTLNYTIGLILANGVIASAHAENITLYDYTEATSAYEEAYIGGNLNITKNREDKQTAYDLNLNIDYDKVFSSSDRDTTLRVYADGNVKRDGTEDADSVDNYTAGASATVDNYFTPNSNTGFWYGSASIDSNSAYDDAQTKAVVGVGYGRVTNVTPMAKAIRIMDELKSRNILKAAPSKGAYQAIAQIIAKEKEYVSKYGGRDYQQYWINDMEKVLKSQNLIQGNFNAAGVLRTYHVLVNEKISTRKHGWKVRAGLGYVGQNFEGLSSKPALEVGAEYHKPLNNRTQFSNELVGTTILNNGDNAYNIKNIMSLTHEIDDRIDWENSWVMDYNANALDDDEVMNNTVTSRFAYELVNELDFTVTGKISNTDGSNDIDNPDGTDRALLMGVRYRLK
ncbi:MAG TPA: DUF481 domain-containing protein [Thiothrix sp.]|nr:DUF481 domain-containing protein [Thiothrix sp.]